MSLLHSSGLWFFGFMGTEPIAVGFESPHGFFFVFLLVDWHGADPFFEPFGMRSSLSPCRLQIASRVLLRFHRISSVDRFFVECFKRSSLLSAQSSICHRCSFFVGRRFHRRQSQSRSSQWHGVASVCSSSLLVFIGSEPICS